MNNNPRTTFFDYREATPSNRYKTIEQIVKIGKANTKPVSVRLSVDTLRYFEENAKKFNTKTGTIISDVLDDYVKNLKAVERRNCMGAEIALMNLCRHLADANSDDFFINYLVDKTSKDTGLGDCVIINPKQVYGGEDVTSIFFAEESEKRDNIIKTISKDLQDIKSYETEHVEDINGDPEKDPAVFALTPKNLFVNIDGVLLAPYNIDFMYQLDYTFSGDSIFIIPVEDWLLITSIIVESVFIKTMQLDRKINIYSFVRAVLEDYNQNKKRMTDKPKIDAQDSAKDSRSFLMHYRRLIHAIARYEDLPNNYELPTNLDEEST